MAQVGKCWGNKAAPWLLWSTVWGGEGLGGSVGGFSAVQGRGREAQMVLQCQERDTNVQKVKCSKS